MKKNILITGCAGSIGSHIMDFYLKNYKILGLDNLSTGKKFFLKKALENKIFYLLK